MKERKRSAEGGLRREGVGLPESWSPLRLRAHADASTLHSGGCQAGEKNASRLAGHVGQPANPSGPSLGSTTSTD